jgi:DNA polymerase-3 subunit alpha
MEALVAERTAGGNFANIDDFAARIDPKLLNRRQIEALVGAGAFDSIDADRAALYAGAEHILQAANSAASERASGQGGLFGGEDIAVAALQLPRIDAWSLAERMAKERDAFGFYFSAHPVQQYEAILAARGAQSYAAICAREDFTPGTRVPMVMAGMVENIRWRTSQRGNRFAMVQMSDRSGQFQSSCFDEAAAKALEALAENGGCALLGVECDLLEGEETPRITIRTAQPLAALAASAALRLECEVTLAEALPDMAKWLTAHQGARGRVIVVTHGPEGEAVHIELGRNFVIDPDLKDRLERIGGVGNVTLDIDSGPDFRVRAVG